MSLKKGLPYGWWRTDPGTLAVVVTLAVLCVMLCAVIYAWFGLL